MPLYSALPRASGGMFPLSFMTYFSCNHLVLPPIMTQPIPVITNPRCGESTDGQNRKLWDFGYFEDSKKHNISKEEYKDEDSEDGGE